MEKFEDVERAAVDTVGATEPEAVYEAPELIELGRATALTQGILYILNYQDCGDNGYTDYRPTC